MQYLHLTFINHIEKNERRKKKKNNRSIYVGERERERERNIKINQDINIEKSKLGKEIVVTCSTIH